MSEHQVNPKVVNRISPELDKALKGSQLQTVALKDGKGLCPGCSQEVTLSDPAANVQFTSVPVQCQSCKTEFRVVADQEIEEEEEEPGPDGNNAKDMEDVLAGTGAELLDNGDEGEKAGMTNIPEAELVAFFLRHPNPTDDAFHEHSEEKGWDNKAAEAKAYELATRYSQFRMGGKSKGVRPDQVDNHEELRGRQIEYEHTSNPDDALKIAWDHLTEVNFSKYYTLLDLMEKALKAGPNHALHKELMELVEKHKDLPSGHE
jgi:hypothetical protein